MKKTTLSVILFLFSICVYTQDLPSTLKAALPYLKQKTAVKGIYETYAQQTLWTENGQLNTKGSKVWEILQNVEQYGLLPTQYQVAGIKLALTEQNNNLADVFDRWLGIIVPTPKQWCCKSSKNTKKYSVG
ncbi:MAG: hypothetical protein IPN94_14950 [Sphingobacteriales bacterium]|nr:hypothetical protein [Sphingobacteriales bacterium]